MTPDWRAFLAKRGFTDLDILDSPAGLIIVTPGRMIQLARILSGTQERGPFIIVQRPRRGFWSRAWRRATGRKGG